MDRKTDLTKKKSYQSRYVQVEQIKMCHCHFQELNSLISLYLMIPHNCLQKTQIFYFLIHIAISFRLCLVFIHCLRGYCSIRDIK